ncbi:MAG TPA: DUF1566 domain-containing protein, partial [Flavobacteriales bacterium]|nr:DUF1566 domain-containing protein [Flavobacteriales bacterium]
VVLSPTSVASNNVRDEVSFALENGKVVIPVLIKSCEVPFRWQRLQRVDLTSDYTTGLRQLLDVLGGATGSQSVAEPVKADAIKKDLELERLLWEKAKATDKREAYEHYLEEYPEGQHRTQAEAAVQRTAQRANDNGAAAAVSKKLPWRLIIGAIVLLATGAGVSTYLLQGEQEQGEEPVANPEEGAWLLAITKGDSIAYDGYLKEYPAGPHATIAQQRMDSLHRERKNEGGRIEQDRMRHELDSIRSATALADRRRATLDSIRIGATFHGGRVFAWDPATEKGTLLAGAEPSGGTRVDWNTANQQCEDFQLEGFTDWRMPTIDEMKQIHKTGNHSELASGDANLYWSSTPFSGEVMRLMNFGYGSANYRYSKSNRYRVCAVRDFTAFERIAP